MPLFPFQLDKLPGDFKPRLVPWAAWAGRVLFPPVCAGCRRQVSGPGALCGRCWPTLRLIEPPWCAVLGTPFSFDMGEGAVSPEAIAHPPPFARARAAAVHGGVAAELVRALKYADRTDLAPALARWMLRAGAELLLDADLIVPVPLHRRRFWERRFNQSAELGRAVARLAGRPFEPGALLRRRPTRQQVGLSRGERLRNVRAAFLVPSEGRARVAGRRVLLVDDVFTTGATVGAASRALLRAGASAVDVLTFSRVIPGEGDETAGDFLAGEGELI